MYLMKKVITLALALMLALSLAACGGNSDNGGGSTTTPPSNSGTTTPPSNTPSTSQGGNETTPSNNGGNTVGDAAGWPDNEFTQQVPKPQYSFTQESSGDSTTCRTYPDWTKEQAKAYVTELESAGFAINNSVADYDDQYLAYLQNADQTYKVAVHWDTIDGGLLTISKPFSFD
jgi:uncharacterized lipoprotein YehR (DUF1307 family)